MKTRVRLEEVTERQKPWIGGKAFALAVLARSGFQVPDALCVSTRACELFVQENDLSRRISLEMGQKPFEAMRWEEIWDSALRIRNLFAKSSLPVGLESELARGIAGQFGEDRVSVRSSAPRRPVGLTIRPRMGRPAGSPPGSSWASRPAPVWPGGRPGSFTATPISWPSRPGKFWSAMPWIRT